MFGLLRFFGYLFLAVFTMAASGLAFAAFIFHFFGSDLPDHKQLQDYIPPQTTYIFSSDERLITSYAREKRIYVSLEQMPKLIIDAFLSAEDKSFYENKGIDILAMVRALLITSKGKHLAGGSTITQQLVKNFFLTNERTITRKIKEIILSFRITRTFDKDKILELYLNKIYLGNGTYGIAAASIGYFNKSVEDLNISEAAILASLPKSPSKLDPWRTEHSDLLLQRRNWVINRMMEDGRINKYEAIAAKSRGIELAKPEDRYIDNAFYFGDEVRQQIVNMYGQDCLYTCGLNIITTINPTYQDLAHAALKAGLEKFDKKKGYRGPLANIKDAPEKFDEMASSIADTHTLGARRVALVTSVENEHANLLFVGGKDGVLYRKDVDWDMSSARKKRSKSSVVLRNMNDGFEAGDVILVEGEGGVYKLRQIPAVNGAIVVLDTKTSRILAMAGGYDYKESKFNRATQAKRQPGSVFKTIIYLTALERGRVTPATIITDEPIVVDQGPGLPKWIPRNFNNRYYGAVPVRRGLEQSINAVTIKLLLMTGLKNVINMAKRLGVYSGSGKNLSIALGSEAVDLVAMTNAYAMMANGGKKATPSLLELIHDSSGRVIYRRDSRDCPECAIQGIAQQDDIAAALNYHIPPDPEDNRSIVADPIACYQTISLMEGVVARGTGRSARIAGKHIGGKTGTTNDSKDLWWIGFTNEVVVGVYVGYDEPRDMGEKETGSRVALPIFNSFISQANLQAGPFEIPIGVNMIKIDRFTGLVAHTDSTSEPYITEAFRIGTEPN